MLLHVSSPPGPQPLIRKALPSHHPRLHHRCLLHHLSRHPQSPTHHHKAPKKPPGWWPPRRRPEPKRKQNRLSAIRHPPHPQASSHPPIPPAPSCGALPSRLPHLRQLGHQHSHSRHHPPPAQHRKAPKKNLKLHQPSKKPQRHSHPPRPLHLSLPSPPPHLQRRTQSMTPRSSMP